MLAIVLVAATTLDFQFAGEQCFHYQGEVPARATLEICGALPREEVVQWKATSGSDLAISIHDPTGRAHASGTAGRIAGGQFVSPAGQRYCWRIVNAGAHAAALALEMEHP